MSANPLAAALGHLKILDLSRVLAGPWSTQTLGDMGAEIWKIERPVTGDETRGWGPPYLRDPQADEPGISAYFASANRNKKSLAIDFTSSEGAELICQLASKADIVIENFKVGGLKKYGLDYDSLQSRFPHLIYCSLTGFGQDGPESHRAGYDFMIQAMSGLMSVTGFPDDEPGGMPVKAGVALVDILTGLNATIAILAALEHRKTSGKGQHIDLAQAEAAMHFLTPAILDYTANGHIQTRAGNADSNFAPQGVYPTAGEDEHIAIACETDAQWQALCELISELNSLAENLNEATARVAQQTALDIHIGRFTSNQPAAELEAELQARGIPASVVMNSPELVADPQLRHRGHFVNLPHHEASATVIESSRFHLSRSPTSVDTSAPTFNRDMMEVLTDVLGYDDERIGDLLVGGVFE